MSGPHRRSDDFRRGVAGWIGLPGMIITVWHFGEIWTWLSVARGTWEWWLLMLWLASDTVQNARLPWNLNR